MGDVGSMIDGQRRSSRYCGVGSHYGQACWLKPGRWGGVRVEWSLALGLLAPLLGACQEVPGVGGIGDSRTPVLFISPDSDTGGSNTDSITMATVIRFDLMGDPQDQVVLEVAKVQAGPPVVLSESAVFDQAGNAQVTIDGLDHGVWVTMLTAISDLDSQVRNYGLQRQISVDTIAPEPPQLWVVGQEDLRASTVAQARSLILMGESGAEVTITYFGEEVVEVPFLSAEGTLVSLPDSLMLEDGMAYPLVIAIADQAGNISESTVNLEIGNSIARITLSTDSLSDTGRLNNDGVTHSRSPDFLISAESNTMYNILAVSAAGGQDMVQLLSEVTTDANGVASAMVAGISGILTDGDYRISLRLAGTDTEVASTAINLDFRAPPPGSVTIIGQNNLTASHPGDVVGFRVSGGETDGSFDLSLGDVSLATGVRFSADGHIDISLSASGFALLMLEYDMQYNLTLTTFDLAGNSTQVVEMLSVAPQTGGENSVTPFLLQPQDSGFRSDSGGDSDSDSDSVRGELLVDSESSGGKWLGGVDPILQQVQDTQDADEWWSGSFDWAGP